MSSITKKAGNTTGIHYDSQSKAVMTALKKGERQSINQMITSVGEVVRNKSKNEISMVLQYYDYNVSEAIAAFMEDGAATALQAWNFNGTKANKKNKKKDVEKPDVTKQANAGSIDNALNAAEIADSIAGNEGQNGSTVGTSVFKVPDAKLTRNKSAGDSQANNKPTPTFAKRENNRNAKSNNRDVRKESVSESIDGEEKMGRGKKGIEKCSKELGRHSLSLQRARVVMNEEIERSEKRLKQSFQELHRILETRESELIKQLSEAKLKANVLLNSRQDSASRLRIAADQADGLTEDELNELRIDIKHFVSERKFDDDLSRTVFFIRDHDRLLKEIREYGEVAPIKSQYTGRRQSLSSTASSLTPSDPSGSGITSPVIKIPATSEFANTATTASATVAPTASRSQSLSELAELQQRLQASLRMQGLPATTAAPVRTQRPPRTGQAPPASGSRDHLGNGSAKVTNDGDAPKQQQQQQPPGGSSESRTPDANKGRRRRPPSDDGGRGRGHANIDAQ